MPWSVYRRMTAHRRAFEVLAALFALWLGLGTWGDYGDGLAPFAWTGTSIDAQVMAARLLTIGGMIHAIGMWIDGRYPLSEILRIIGIALMAGIFMWLCTHGSGASAARTYFAAVVGCCFCMVGAFRDLVAAREVRNE